MPEAVYGGKLEALHGCEPVACGAARAWELQALVEGVEPPDLAFVEAVACAHGEETLNAQLLPQAVVRGVAGHLAHVGVEPGVDRVQLVAVDVGGCEGGCHACLGGELLLAFFVGHLRV